MMVSCLQIDLIGFRVVGGSCKDRRSFIRYEPHLKRRDDGLCDLILQSEDVGQVAVEAFGPHGVSGCAVNQLGIDPQPVAGLANAALNDMGNPQPPRDLGHIDRPPLEGEGGVAGDNRKGAHLAQIGDDIF